MSACERDIVIYYTCVQFPSFDVLLYLVLLVLFPYFWDDHFGKITNKNYSQDVISLETIIFNTYMLLLISHYVEVHNSESEDGDHETYHQKKVARILETDLCRFNHSQLFVICKVM